MSSRQVGGGASLREPLLGDMGIASARGFSFFSDVLNLIRPTLALTFILGLSTAARADDSTLTREAFTEDFVKRLAVAVPGHAFRMVGPLDVRDDADKGVALAPLKVDLERLYADFLKDPSRREVVLSQYFALLAHGQQRFEMPVNKEWIYVVVSTRAECARLRTYHENRAGFFFARPLLGDLMQVVVCDRPGVQTLVNEKQREALGLDEATLFTLGLEHTRKRFEATLTKLTATKPAGVQVLRESGVSALLVLPPDAWATCRQSWGTDIVVSAPGNSCVVIGPKAAERKVRAQAEREFKAADIPLSREVFTMTGG